VIRPALPPTLTARPTPRLRTVLAGVAALLTVGVALTGCGQSISAIVGSTSTTADPNAVVGTGTSTTKPAASGEVAVAFPVVTCTSGFGVPLTNQGWKPSVLLAPIPTALVGDVEFYTDGTHTLLGPEGWNCSSWSASPGATGLAVYPSNLPAPAANTPAQPGDEGIFANFDTTGRTAGIAAVCPYFTIPSWQKQEANCSGTPPAGEQTAMPTPDVATITDPSGVAGTLEGSGGTHAVSGVVIFPQLVPAVTDGSAVAIAEESCSLVETSLCPTVISDFEVREFPVPAGRG
jgi:hypothetical protein